MKKQIFIVIGVASLLVTALAVTAQVLVSPQENVRQGNSLVGSWDVVVTVRNCETGGAIFSFPAMITYNQGGTMNESDLGAPGLTRLHGHGTWSRGRAKDYSASFRWLNFNPDRSFAGTNIVRSAVRLSNDGNSYTSTDTTELHIDGNIIPIACGTQTATRFE